MQRSNDRILTTHAGRLLSSNNLGQITPSAGAQPNRDELVPAIREGIREVVDKQVAAGIDIISDGEIGKIGGVTYFGPRMNGIERKIPSGDGPAMMSQRTNERIEFADFYATLGNFRNTSPERLVCVAPLSFKGDGEIQSDIRLFADELEAWTLPSSSCVRWLPAGSSTACGTSTTKPTKSSCSPSPKRCGRSTGLSSTAASFSNWTTRDSPTPTT